MICRQRQRRRRLLSRLARVSEHSLVQRRRHLPQRRGFFLITALVNLHGPLRELAPFGQGAWYTAVSD